MGKDNYYLENYETITHTISKNSTVRSNIKCRESTQYCTIGVSSLNPNIYGYIRERTSTTGSISLDYSTYTRGPQIARLSLYLPNKNNWYEGSLTVNYHFFTGSLTPYDYDYYYKFTIDVYFNNNYIFTGETKNYNADRYIGTSIYDIDPNRESMILAIPYFLNNIDKVLTVRSVLTNVDILCPKN